MKLVGVALLLVCSAGAILRASGRPEAQAGPSVNAASELKGDGQHVPPAGSVFREFTFLPKGNHFAECDPQSQRDFCKSREHMVPRPLDIDLTDAVRCEVCVEYWGGHIGTADQKFRVNGNDWRPIPQPSNTPSEPQRYYRNLMGNPSVPVPLEELTNGTNTFQFTCGPQIAYGFDWGFYWIYAFTVRVYYDPQAVPHPTGRISSPEASATIGDSPTFTVAAESPGGHIERVDLIGYYEDFDWAGNGEYRDWHYQYRRGEISHHIGTATQAPYTITWDTTWVPDQDRPVKIMARITDAHGVSAMSPAVEVSLARSSRSVRMYRPHDVPENFGVRVGRRKTCTINVADDLGQARAARLVLSTWSAAHADEIGLNGTVLVPRIGKVHFYSYDAIPVPLELIRRGPNEFHVHATTEHHAAEINWPGPVLFIEYTTE